MNQTIVIGKLPNETEEQARARIDAALDELDEAMKKKAALLKKLGMR